MRKGAATFSRNPSARIDEADEPLDDSSSSSDYEQQLIPGPQVRAASSNLFEGELAERKGDAAGSDAEPDEDEEDVAVDEDLLGAGDKEEAIRERIAQSQEQMKFLLDMFSEDQLRRYETFRRVGFPRQAIKKLMVRVLDQQVNQNSVIVVSGIAKVYVGELVEEARKVMDDVGETGPIQPSHLLEAQRRMKAAGLTTASLLYRRSRNKLF